MNNTFGVVTLDGQQHLNLEEATVREWYQRQYLRDHSPVIVWGSNEWRQLCQVFDVSQWQQPPASAAANEAPPTLGMPSSAADGNAVTTRSALLPPGSYRPPVAQPFGAYQKPVVYGSALGLGIATCVGVAAQIITRIIHLLTFYGNDVYIVNRYGRTTAPPDVAQTAYILYALFILVWIATAIICSFWIYRAYKNLRALGHTHTEFTPGWAVGYFFVPVVGLWKPYQAVSELWKKSDPSESASGSAIVAFWWVCFLLLGFANWIGTTLISARAPEAGFPLVVVSMIANVIAGLLLIAIIIGVNGRQEERARILRETPEQLTSTPAHVSPYSLRQ